MWWQLSLFGLLCVACGFGAYRIFRAHGFGIYLVFCSIMAVSLGVPAGLLVLRWHIDLILVTSIAGTGFSVGYFLAVFIDKGPWKRWRKKTSEALRNLLEKVKELAPTPSPTPVPG